MNGVNLDGINNLVNKNNAYYESVNDDVKHIAANLNELNNLYSGGDLKFLFQDLTNQAKSINTIPIIVKNYSDILKNVVLSYKAQDVNLRNQVNHIISKTNM